MPMIQTRRRFLSTMAAGTAACILPYPQAEAAEPPPETTTVRLSKFLAICFAPQYVCEELLRAEGFTEVRYADLSVQEQFNSDPRRVDFLSNLTLNHVGAIDAGAPITIVSPIHGGCYELFAHDGIRTICAARWREIRSLSQRIR